MSKDIHIQNFNKGNYNVYVQEPRLDVEVKVEEIEDYETDLIILHPETKDTELYENHVIKEEMVIGPEELHTYSPVNYEINVDNNSNINHKKQYDCEKSERNQQFVLQESQENNQYMCKKCNISFQTKRALQYHFKGGHTSKACQYCNKYIDKTSNRTRHENSCANNNSVLENNSVPKYSMTTHQFICDYCNKSYSHRSTLIKHIRVHTIGEERHMCGICHKSYIKKHALTCHVRSKHLKVNIYRCKYCSTTFAWLAGLTSHVQKYHKGCS